MKKESLEKASNIIIKALEKSDIEELDKLEIMLNVFQFLENYHKDLDILRKVKRNDKTWTK